MSGLTPTGFVVPTTSQLLTSIEQDELGTIDSGIDTGPDQPLGEINGIFASKCSDVWQGQQECYGALDPGNAEGVQLDVCCSLTGTIRNPANPTQVIVNGTGTATSLANAVLDNNGNVVTHGAVLAQVQGHPEYGTFTNAVPILVAGSAPVFPPPGTAAAPWNPSAGYACLFVCMTPGATPCPAGTLTVITPPVTGLTSISNAADGLEGSPVETDAQLRIRRVVELVPPNGATNDSMRNTLLRVQGSGPGLQGVINATVFENDTNAVDGNGLPPHSTMAVIWDGAAPQAPNNAIAQAIWNSKASGIQPYDGGSGLSGTAIDAAGNSHTIGFARATQLLMYIAITVAVDSTFDTVNGRGAVAAALVAFGNALVQGQKVVVLECQQQVIAATINGQAIGVKGVRDVTIFKVDTNSTPANTANWPVGILQIARFDTGRVTVATVPYS